MLVALTEGSVELSVDFEAGIGLTIEPGVWQVTHRGEDFSVTTLRARLVAGELYFAYPKGVVRKRNGNWSLQERVLVDLLPLEPAKAWKVLPDILRSALEDAYLLARHDLPEQLER